MKAKIMQAILAITFAAIVLPSTGAAQSVPINIALFNPVQIFSESHTVTGLRIDLIYGKNAGIAGLDWGLVNGVGSGGVSGLQWGFVNSNDGDFFGLQGGFINLSDGDVHGVQYGFYNYGGHVSGLQLGFINNAGSMKGIQIGLINIIKTGGFMPVFPIINWSF
ncbi:MAG TPA: hypothetical protein VLX91_08935 [Candidatus Acidoferrales bacterium]|nr:hypothetical protein [Candidatus Acidoferrales bacterium]